MERRNVVTGLDGKHPFAQNGFDPTHERAMRDAYAGALSDLSDEIYDGYLERVQAVVAEAITELAKAGQRDEELLRRYAVHRGRTVLP